MQRGVTGRCGLYQMMGLNSARTVAGRTIFVERRITINRPVFEVYTRWREYEKWPEIDSNILSVERTGDETWRWCSKGAFELRRCWEAEVIEDIAHRRIAWRTVPDSELSHTGAVRFIADEHAGTVVEVTLEYPAPAGEVGKAMARLVGAEPGAQVEHALRCFKAICETGEVPTTEGQPVVRGSI